MRTLNTQLLLALVLAAGAGCSGKTVDMPASSDAAGIGGAAGISGGASVGGSAGLGGIGALGGSAGVGGAITRAPSQGAATISFTNPDPPAVGPAPLCPFPHTSAAPIFTTGYDPTTSTAKGTEAITGVTETVDARTGNLVMCSVVPVTGGYDVYARIHSEVSDRLGNQWADIEISHLTMAAGQSHVSATLSVSDEVTRSAYSPPTTIPCTFSVTGGSMGIGSGRIWGSVTCAALIDPSSASGDTCKATGYFIFENCAQ
jgi:hypothetical protein